MIGWIFKRLLMLDRVPSALLNTLDVGPCAIHIWQAIIARPNCLRRVHHVVVSQRRQSYPAPPKKKRKEKKKDEERNYCEKNDDRPTG